MWVNCLGLCCAAKHSSLWLHLLTLQLEFQSTEIRHAGKHGRYWKKQPCELDHEDQMSLGRWPKWTNSTRSREEPQVGLYPGLDTILQTTIVRILLFPPQPQPLKNLIKLALHLSEPHPLLLSPTCPAHGNVHTQWLVHQEFNSLNPLNEVGSLFLWQACWQQDSHKNVARGTWIY